MSAIAIVSGLSCQGEDEQSQVNEKIPVEIELRSTPKVSALTHLARSTETTRHGQMKAQTQQIQARVEQARQEQLRGAIRDDDEEDEGPEIPSGIRLEWSRAPGQEAQLEQDFSSVERIIKMDVINLDAIDYSGSAVVTGDAGTMQSRSNSSPLPIKVEANSLHTLEVDFRSASLADQSHSGAVVVQVELCPQSEKGPCLSAISFPLYFHPTSNDEGENMQFYGERVLRSRYGGGDLRKGEGPSEPGLRRVMGGGPLHDLPDDEISPPEDPVDPDDEREASLQEQSAKPRKTPPQLGLHHAPIETITSLKSMSRPTKLEGSR